ncbi:hypothetical protein GCM10011507_01580 [Edaphobacter acidisoli]|uniref:Outer membrane protein beta-barrel domain-containing protein n=1 Tax=Edaphobacter acidisoli TaxID=2040573 RepID=A0A916RHJ2_9BACT|nr:outer membrane beta-barrel protein [Edaphobacter acidisoli]GGA54060.1 hypothetical protein GCM10011507_01580 [Edaphobacter acidisoli]
MHISTPLNRLASILAGTAAIAFFAAPAAVQAQQPASTAQPLAPISLKTTLIAPLDLSSSSTDDVNYTSSTGAVETAKAEGFSFGEGAMQPPPRRRYGRPNYSDSHTNPDGSAKYTFAVGGGFTLPTGGTHNYATPGWKLQVGAGRNFNQTLGVMLQFDYDKFGMQQNTLNNQLALYNSLCGSQCIDQLNGSVHDWSFSLDPIVNYYTSDTLGAYVIGGIGFYHKYTQFTTPAIGEYCDPYYGCYQYQANQPVDWYTSNAFGVNAGFGFTYKISRWANQRLYAEARYVWTDNQPKPYDVSGTTNYFNAFPQASARTTYIPVTFGIRF